MLDQSDFTLLTNYFYYYEKTLFTLGKKDIYDGCHDDVICF